MNHPYGLMIRYQPIEITHENLTLESFNQITHENLTQKDNNISDYQPIEL